MRSLLVEAHAGISGDMFVGAASSLAGCEQEILDLPELLGLQGVSCSFSKVKRASIGCLKFDVIVDGSDAGHGHHHRPLSRIRSLVEGAPLDSPIKSRAVRMLERLGQIEAALHEVPVDDVIFHEVGAVDSIVDVVAAALCIERLAVDTVFCTPICVGFGMVSTAHGQLPVPAPATEQLLQGMRTTTGKIEGEWTTPTGALILDELKVRFEWPVHVTIASSYGGGSLNPPGRPNVLRLRVVEIERSSDVVTDGNDVVELRCNIDDSAGEMLGADLVAALLEYGALDVAIYPVIMKKGRPGHVIEVLVEPELVDAMAGNLLEMTSTIGVRMRRTRRITLPRTAAVVATDFGEVVVKVVHLSSGRRRIRPEYESCHKRAREAGVPIHDVYVAALNADPREID